MTIAAILLCDRKAFHQMTALPAVAQLAGVDRLYLNIESDLPPHVFRVAYEHMIHYLEHVCPVGWDMDVWRTFSTWLARPAYDQDQVRLAPITQARNMAVDYALSHFTDKLLFMDADVVPDPAGWPNLLNLKHPLVGGWVPGRGAHSHVHYVSGTRRGIQQRGDVLTCDHGTMGYCLIDQSLFRRVRFRWGESREYPGVMLSEDPAFAEDVYLMTGERWYIDKRATAEHRDDPARPLVAGETAQDAWSTIRVCADRPYWRQDE